MSKSDRRTQHIAEKIRRGEVVPELKNLPVTYSVERPIPVECKPYSMYSGSNSNGNSLY